MGIKREYVSEARLSIIFPNEMREKLIELAMDDDRSLSSYIRTALIDHINQKTGTTATPKRTKRRIKR